jgi:predicted RNA-binding protein YlxR (DUF448 family)
LVASGCNQPWRTCVACGRKAPQAELQRMALKGDRVLWDPRRRLPGRGAYICPQRECLGVLARDRKKGRIFRRQISEEAWAELIDIASNEASPLFGKNG